MIKSKILPSPDMTDLAREFTTPMLTVSKANSCKAFEILAYLAEISLEKKSQADDPSEGFTLIARPEDFHHTRTSNFNVAEYKANGATLFGYSDGSALIGCHAGETERSPLGVLPVPFRLRNHSLFHRATEENYSVFIQRLGARSSFAISAHYKTSRGKMLKKSEAGCLNLSGYPRCGEDIPYDVHRDAQIALAREVDAWADLQHKFPRLTNRREDFSFAEDNPELCSPAYLHLKWKTKTAKEKLDQLLLDAALFVESHGSHLVLEASIDALNTTFNPETDSISVNIEIVEKETNQWSSMKNDMGKAISRIIKSGNAGVVLEDMIDQDPMLLSKKHLNTVANISAGSLPWRWQKKEFSAHEIIHAAARFAELCRSVGLEPNFIKKKQATL